MEEVFLRGVVIVILLMQRARSGIVQYLLGPPVPWRSASALPYLPGRMLSFVAGAS